MKSPLVDIAGDEPAVRPGALSGVGGYLEADPVQAGSAGGLVVAVGLENHGDAEVALVNPVALLQFLLRNEEGYPVDLPSNVPPPFVHTAGGEDWSSPSAIPIVGFLRNSQPADASALAGRTVRLAGGEHLHVAFAVMVPAGAYSISVLVTLINAEQTADSRILQSGEIAIQFRPRPD